MPLFEDKSYPANLIKETLKDPTLYAELVCFMYKPNPPIEGEFEGARLQS